MIRTLKVLCLLGAPLVGLGCTGAIGEGNGTSQPGGGNAPGNPSGPSNPGGGGPSNPGGGGPSDPGGPITTGPAAKPGAGALSDDASVPGVAPVRRLTQVEYDNTLRDLLGLTISVSKTTKVGEDLESGNGGFVKGGAVSTGDDARGLMAAASQVTDTVRSRLASLLPCMPIPTAAADQEACATKFITQFGKRAYRRPLTPTETDLAKKLYTTQRSAEVGASFEDAIGALVAGFIQAPQFLYHWELGSAAPIKDGKLIRYNSYEIASRLSYLFWATMPDDKLFAAADANALNTPEQIALQARRLLADDRAKQGLTDFHLQWMEIGPLTQAPKDDTVKNFSPAIAQSMLNETRDFVSSLFLGPKAAGTLEALLTSKSSVVDANLAKIYGVNVTGTNPQEVALNPAQRAGILTQLAFLTAKADTGDSHPVKRGDAVLKRVLCTELKIPTEPVPAVADAEPGGATTRQRFMMHAMNPCATCHVLIDPIGFAFEGYDTVGAYRTMENNKPIDTTGQVMLPSGDTLKFTNAVDLITQLSKRTEAQECMTTQWVRYALGRREVASEDPSIKVAHDVFKKANFDIRELLVALTRTRSFTHRSPSPGEVTQ